MKNILIIEDNEEMRQILVKILTKEGYIVDSAENGKIGIEKIMEKDFDVVLTDIIMPALGGMDVLQEIKRVKPKIRVIMMTAFGTIENAVEAIKVGASDYITKPFKKDEVQIKIRRVFAELELEENITILDSKMIKAISNPIRKDTVKLLGREGKLRFTDIKNILKIDDATKLSFHLRILKSQGIIEQDKRKVYMLTIEGKKLIENLIRAGMDER
ncbi:MAG: response regulator [ANME-2 cluster archaeon]|nr:MAG: response regulator [ANME-2 cluster archaeon]